MPQENMGERTINRDDQAVEGDVEILNTLGLHARPAMQFVDVASGFASEITIHKDDMSVNGKNLMDVMMLAATQGTRLRVRAAGPDAPEAIEALTQLVLRKFDEEE